MEKIEIVKDYIYLICNDDKKYLNVKLVYESGKVYSQVIWLNDYNYKLIHDNYIEQTKSK